VRGGGVMPPLKHIKGPHGHRTKSNILKVKRTWKSVLCGVRYLRLALWGPPCLGMKLQT